MKLSKKHLIEDPKVWGFAISLSLIFIAFATLFLFEPVIGDMAGLILLFIIMMMIIFVHFAKKEETFSRDPKPGEIIEILFVYGDFTQDNTTSKDEDMVYDKGTFFIYRKYGKNNVYLTNSNEPLFLKKWKIFFIRENGKMEEMSKD